MKELTLQISIDEANIILEALGNMPFAKVYELIGKIQDQAGRQLREGSSPEPASSPDHQPLTLDDTSDV